MAKIYSFVKNPRLSQYLQTYRPFLMFLGKFFLTYIVLTLVYQFYLSQFNDAANDVDGFTRAVASQSEWLTDLLGVDAALAPHDSQPAVKFLFNNEYVARIIEGCNALSVMILFIAFIIAFSGRVRTTILFIIAGCVIIHILNISRIALLAAAIYHYPEYENFLHGVIFPLIIYSTVFLLWVIWVNKYSTYASKSN